MDKYPRELSNYIANPTEENFQLTNNVISNVTPLVVEKFIENVWEITCLSSKNIMYKHLGILLYNENRFCEAQYYIKLWINITQNNEEGILLLQQIAVKRCDINSAYLYIEKLKSINAISENILMSEISFNLMIGNISEANNKANELIKTYSAPLSAINIYDVAIKTKDLNLITKLLTGKFANTIQSAISKREKLIITKLYRKKITQILILKSRLK